MIITIRIFLFSHIHVRHIGPNDAVVEVHPRV